MHKLDSFRFVVNAVIATGLVIAGITLGVLAIKQLKREFTTLNPFRPNTTSSLVTSGIFKFTRNPMYLGMLFILIGFAIFLGKLSSFMVLPAFCLLLTEMQIKPEERILEEKFGDEYLDYKSRVRRWL